MCDRASSSSAVIQRDGVLVDAYLGSRILRLRRTDSAAFFEKKGFKTVFLNRCIEGQPLKLTRKRLFNGHLARNVWVDSISARFLRASLRNAPFRKITMKAFTSKKTANERASEKGLAAARTFPIG